MDKRILALIAALLATSIFGLNYTIAKELMPNILSPNALLYCSVLGAAVLFWFISFFLKWEKVEIKDFKLIIICSIFGMGLNTVSYTDLTLPTTPYV